MLHSQPEKYWTAEMVSREMRSNTTSASTQLDVLFKRGLLSVNSEKQYRYQPASKELEEKVKLLNDFYHEKPVAVITAIFEKPNDKLRGLADAFKLKKD